MTFGQMTLQRILPADVYTPGDELDKHGIKRVLTAVAARHPEKYKDISFKMLGVGRKAAYESGGFSFGLKDLKTTERARNRRKVIAAEVEQILDKLPEKQRDAAIIKLLEANRQPDRDEILEDSYAEDNPLAMQLKGAGRGNASNLQRLRGSDLAYQDSNGNTVAVPILRSYSQGLSPGEYWAGTYGARLGVNAAKLSVASSGYLAKLLNQVTHREVVEEMDAPDGGEDYSMRGLPVDVEDNDNVGALLSRPAGGFARNTVLTPKVLKQLKAGGIKRILVRSPIAMSTPNGGVYARDVGVRENSRLPQPGENVGMVAAQALSEVVTQSTLSSKHGGGVAGNSGHLSGFTLIERLVNPPKEMRGVAVHADVDGFVRNIAKAPQGGSYLFIGDKQHYVPPGFDPKVAVGDQVEAGQVLTTGTPNPFAVSKHMGIGEGRRYFVKAMSDAMQGAGFKPNRRNVELLARGLVNYVKFDDEYEDFSPGEVVPYHMAEAAYRPREDAHRTDPRSAIGSYLEKPVLHYSVGTKIRPSMIKDFDDFEVKEVLTHTKPAPFRPEAVRAIDALKHDPDWMTRMYGSGLKKNLTTAVHNSSISDQDGTSFIPSAARNVNFGNTKIVNVNRAPEPPKVSLFDS